MDEGHLMRGVETMLPKALKNAVKAQRYTAQGVNNLRGDALVENLGLRDTLLQLFAFTPAQVAAQYDDNRALENSEPRIPKRREHLLHAFALALRVDDDEARIDTLEKIHAFNQVNAEIPITPKGLRQSIGYRARCSEQAENGISLNKRLAAKARRAKKGEGD